MMLPDGCTPKEAALFYAANGLPVIPLYTPRDDGSCGCPDPKCKDIGKHPRIARWTNDASTDPDIISKWWGWWPDANVSILTGKRSGRIILDVDPDAGGWETIAALEAEHEPLPATVVVITGGGGMHVHLGHPLDRLIKNSAGELGAGIDIRGDGGMAIVPPSLHKSGERYRWDEIAGVDGVLAEGTIAPLPAWLIPKTAATARVMTGTDEPIALGQRNRTLTAIAGAMRRHGAPEEAILAALIATNAGRCDPPLDDREVDRIARSVARYVPQPMTPGDSGAIRGRRPELNGGVRRG